MRSPSSFRPSAASTVSIAATTTSGRVALTGTTMQTRVFVASGSPPTFIEFGSTAVTAVVSSTGTTVGSLPVAVGINDILSIPQGATNVAAITSSGTATVFFSAGEGV